MDAPAADSGTVDLPVMSYAPAPPAYPASPTPAPRPRRGRKIVVIGGAIVVAGVLAIGAVFGSGLLAAKPEITHSQFSAFVKAARNYGKDTAELGTESIGATSAAQYSADLTAGAASLTKDVSAMQSAAAGMTGEVHALAEQVIAAATTLDSVWNSMPSQAISGNVAGLENDLSGATTDAAQLHRALAQFKRIDRHFRV